ncbi:MAG: N-acetyltransferase [Devosia sp.]
MKFWKRGYRGKPDLAEVLRLAAADPASHIHLVDLPYRLCSWGLDDSRNVGVWADGDGHMIGFAVVQPPFQTLDMTIQRHPENAELIDTIVRWALQRFRDLAKEETADRQSLYISVPQNEILIEQLERHGFSREPWFFVHQHMMLEDLTLHRASTGYDIRSLKGIDEVEAYVELHRAAFGSKNMTAEWRRRMLQHELYVPELDLVAVASDGTLAGFCICWIDGDRKQGQIEPLGVHPNHQRAGLGVALVCEAVGRLRRLGAKSAGVYSYSVDDAAQATYRAAGFKQLQNIPALVARNPPPRCE